MTRQTTEPLHHTTMLASARPAREIARLFHDGEGDLNPTYQRGSVWTEDQRINLVKSWLLGVPVPTIVINDRIHAAWESYAPDGTPEGGYFYGVIDGKQRVETAIAWFFGDLAVPASWFPAEHIDTTTPTDDGPYVRYRGLTTPAQRYAANRFMLPTVEARVDSIQDEAALYLLLNGEGTAQTEADMANAARVAGTRP